MQDPSVRDMRHMCSWVKQLAGPQNNLESLVLLHGYLWLLRQAYPHLDPCLQPTLLNMCWHHVGLVLGGLLYPGVQKLFGGVIAAPACGDFLASEAGEQCHLCLGLYLILGCSLHIPVALQEKENCSTSHAAVNYPTSKAAAMTRCSLYLGEEISVVSCPSAEILSLLSKNHDTWNRFGADTASSLPQ